MFVNYAHRGASAYAPENTMAAFRLGLEMGANGIELDLQETKDGKLVIFHDDEIDQKSSGTGKIRQYTYHELLQMDFGSWFGAEYKKESIVLFEEFAKTFFDKNLIFAVELKEAGMETEVLKIIKKYGNLKRIYISSFLFEALQNMRMLNENVKLSWLINAKVDEALISQAKKIAINQICPNAQTVTEPEIEFIRKNGFEIRFWGVKDENIMRRALQWESEGMTVNFPDKLQELINADHTGK